MNIKIILFLTGICLIPSCAMWVIDGLPANVKKSSTENAINFIGKNNSISNTKLELVECSDTDSENDRYVTCSVIKKVGIVNIQSEIFCSYGVSLFASKSCKFNKSVVIDEVG